MMELIQATPDSLEDEVLRYVIHGWMKQAPAEQLCALPLEERTVLVETVTDLTEQELEAGQTNRAEWVARMLGRDEVTSSTRSVFVQTVKTKPEVGRKSGLGDRAFTTGRHSSGDTSGW